MTSAWNVCLAASLAMHVLLLTGGIFPGRTDSKSLVKAAEAEKKEITIHPQTIEKIKSPDEKSIRQPHQPDPLPFVEHLLGKMLEGTSQQLFEKSAFLEKTAKEILLSEKPSQDALMQNPAYMDYYRLIREKIRANTYKNYDIKKQGEILASFVVLSDGSLQDVNLTAEISEYSSLCAIAQKSIEKAAPFPAFPEELREYSSLHFNILIYFKNN